MRTVIVATKNAGKLREISSLLHNEFDRFLSLLDLAEEIDIDEDSLLYTENAMKKARKVGDMIGMDTIADDSGLEVDALGGRPGIHSSRFGPTDAARIDRLLTELGPIPWERRTAVFKAYVVFYRPAMERTYLFYGNLPGIIGFERQGEGGFGFDPVFYVPQYGRYLAELPVEEKNRISHRGRALMALKKFLNESGTL
jgi:XTP/dITP diphosphohydrolase